MLDLKLLPLDLLLLVQLWHHVDAISNPHDDQPIEYK